VSERYSAVYLCFHSGFLHHLSGYTLCDYLILLYVPARQLPSARKWFPASLHQKSFIVSKHYARTSDRGFPKKNKFAAGRSAGWSISASIHFPN
jgi:hypothetical protein